MTGEESGRRREPLVDHGALDRLEGFDSGAPAWLRGMINYCSRCGRLLAYGPVDGEHRERLACGACGFIAYVNPRMAVTTIPVTDAGEVVLLRRAIEPGYGGWAQPGGFLEADETAIQGAIRETLEETCLVVEPTGIIGIYSRPQAAIVVVAFEARIVGGVMAATKESLEVRAFPPGAIPWAEIPFDTSVWALSDWLRTTHPELAADLPDKGFDHG